MVRVSDLGLATMSGKDGLRVSLRSIATAEPMGDVTVRLIARNNEVLAETKSAADGTVLFEPGLMKAKAAMRRPSSSRSRLPTTTASST